MNEKQPHVLVVEDQEPVRSMLKRLLEKHALSVELAASGEEALLLLERGGRFDLIVADLLMPGVHGIAFLKLLCDHDPRTPVIVLTGSEISRSSIRAAGCNVADYLRKPLETGRLVEAVRDALSAAR